MYMVPSWKLALVVLFWLCSFRVCEGEWGEWGAWSSCSQTCGMGMQTRMRQCIAAKDERCHYTNATEEVGCSVKEYCKPVNGAFGQWSAWNNCSRRCGGGTHWRNRECNKPRPMYGGKMCTGDMEEIAQCATHACPPLYTKNDSIKCGHGHVVCGSGKECIVVHHRCDGFYDCQYGSDESACIKGEPVIFIQLNETGSTAYLRSSALPFTAGVLSLLYSWSTL